MEKIKNFAKTFDEGVLALSENLLNKKIGKHIRLMPDTHIGKGSAIGFTALMTDRIAPEVVGVDIYCGMSIAKLKGKNLNFADFDRYIKENIPNGFDKKHIFDTHHKDIKYLKKGQFIEQFIDKLSPEIRAEMKDPTWYYRQLGSLGSGNHFIEIDKDETTKELFLTIHSGSRGFGAYICSFWQNKAIEQRKNAFALKRAEILEKLKTAENKDKASFAKLLSKLNAKEREKGTAYLVGEWKEKYLQDMRVAQKYGKLNRELMIKIIAERFPLTFWFDSPHNFIDEYDIIRKGATSARKGEYLIIPLNMKAGILICEGKGNEDWNFSAPHGAGRLMSRMKAFKTLNLKDAEKEMEGVFTTTLTIKTLDEAPKVYKDPNEIIELIEPSVKIIKNIKSIYNFKGSN